MARATTHAGILSVGLLGALALVAVGCDNDSGDSAVKAERGGAGSGVGGGAGVTSSSSGASGGAATGTGGAAGGSCGSTPTVDSDLSGVSLFPSDNPWNTPIDGQPVDPASDEIIAGSNCAPGSCAAVIVETAMPINVTCAVAATTTFAFVYASQSDVGPYPMTANLLGQADPSQPLALLQEAGPCGLDGCTDGKDHHVLIMNRSDAKLYELYQPYKDASGTWRAAGGAIFDTTSNALRPDGWTSADAAGLPMTPGLVRCAEVEAGEIRHALRFTLSQTKPAFIHPATHLTHTSGAAPMGARFRLKASVDITTFSAPGQVILTALKKYGMFVADNGTNFGITAEGPSSCWMALGLAEYASGFYFLPAAGGNAALFGSDFEVVQMGQEYTTEQ